VEQQVFQTGHLFKGKKERLAFLAVVGINMDSMCSCVHGREMQGISKGNGERLAFKIHE
jgi:hypothetical protein